MLTDKYQTVKKKFEDKPERDDRDSRLEIGEIPTSIKSIESIENENFDPATEDFNDDADDVAGGGDGRCRPVEDFDPDDKYDDMPGLNVTTLFTVVI